MRRFDYLSSCPDIVNDMAAESGDTEEAPCDRIIVRAGEEGFEISHYDACKGAAFKVGKEGKYRLLPDRKGVLEVKEGVKRLIPVRRNSQTLLGNWQVYNLGDGCMVIGLSESGTVRFSYDDDNAL